MAVQEGAARAPAIDGGVPAFLGPFDPLQFDERETQYLPGAKRMPLQEQSAPRVI